MSIDYDMVIHGAGIPGLTLALAMTRQLPDRKPRILLLDRQDLQVDVTVLQKPTSAMDFDSRVFALTYASKGLFERIGIWPGDAESGSIPMSR